MAIGRTNSSGVQPKGKILINENGKYDVTKYSDAEVEVSGVGDSITYTFVYLDEQCVETEQKIIVAKGVDIEPPVIPLTINKIEGVCPDLKAAGWNRLTTVKSFDVLDEESGQTITIEKQVYENVNEDTMIGQMYETVDGGTHFIIDTQAEIAKQYKLQPVISTDINKENIMRCYTTTDTSTSARQWYVNFYWGEGYPLILKWTHEVDGIETEYCTTTYDTGSLSNRYCYPNNVNSSENYLPANTIGRVYIMNFKDMYTKSFYGGTPYHSVTTIDYRKETGYMVSFDLNLVNPNGSIMWGDGTSTEIHTSGLISFSHDYKYSDTVDKCCIINIVGDISNITNIKTDLDHVELIDNNDTKYITMNIVNVDETNTINWGDGIVENISLGNQTLSHGYTDNKKYHDISINGEFLFPNSYEQSINIHEEGTYQQLDSNPNYFIINNVIIEDLATVVNINVSLSYNSIYKPYIYWGDDSRTQISTTSQNNYYHIYENLGNYTIEVKYDFTEVNNVYNTTKDITFYSCNYGDKPIVKYEYFQYRPHNGKAFVNWGDGSYTIYGEEEIIFHHIYEDYGDYSLKVYLNSTDYTTLFSPIENHNNIFSYPYKNNLKSVFIGEIEYLSEQCFYQEYSLEMITLGSKLKTLPSYMVYQNYLLTTLILPLSIKSINYNSLYYYYGDKLLLNDGLENIQTYSCQYLMGIDNINFPNSLTTIGRYAFYGCQNLIDVKLPESVTVIDDYAFAYCSSLKSLETPVFSSNYIVQNCSSLTNLKVRGDTTNLSDYTFTGLTNIRRIELSNGLITLPSFENLRLLKEIEIPNSTTSLVYSNFKNCYSLKRLDLKNITINSATSLFESCFNLEEIINPTFSTTTLSDNTFYNCYKLKLIPYDHQFININSYACCNCYSLQKFNFNNNMYTIKKYAFYNCYNLTFDLSQITSRLDLFAYSFYNCNKLTSLYKSVRVLRGSESYHALSYTSIEEIDASNWFYEYSSGSYTQAYSSYQNDYYHSIFDNMTKLKKLTMPMNSSSAGYNCYYPPAYICDGNILLEEFNYMYNNTTYSKYISAYAFRNCKSLRTINIPVSLTTIYTYAFYGSGIEEFDNIPNTLSTISQYSFAYCENLKLLDFSNTLITTIPDYCFYSSYNLEEVKLSTRVKTISTYAFAYTGIKEMIIQSNITSLGTFAFYGCYQLENLSFGDGLTSIGSSQNIFSKCYNLKNINFNSLTSISSYAFQYSDCSNITWGNVKTIGYNAFQYSKYRGDENHEFTINTPLVSIGSHAFQGIYIKKLFVPSTVTTIGKYAFSYCAQLRYVYSDTVRLFGTSYALYGSAVESIVLGPSVSGTLTYVGYYLPVLKNIDLSQCGSIRLGQYFLHSCNQFEEFIIPSNVTIIDRDSFYYCQGLKELTVPNSVTSFGPRLINLSMIDKSNLEKLTLPHVGYTNQSYSDGTNFDRYPLIYYSFYGSSGYGYDVNYTEYYNYSRLYYYNASNTQLNIYAWVPKSLKIVELTHQKVLFQSSLGGLLLDELYLPNTLERFEYKTFGYYFTENYVTETHINKIYYRGTLSELLNLHYNSYNNTNPLQVCDQLFCYNQYGEFEEVTEITSDDFTDNTIKLNSIVGYKFTDSFEIKDNITNIGSNIFYQSQIKNLKIPFIGSIISNDLNFNYLTVNYNHSIENLTVTKADYIRDYCFANHKSLKSITYESNVTYLGSSTFRNLNDLETIYLPIDSTYNSLANTYDNCYKLKSVRIHKNVTSLGSYVFNNCYNLADLYYDAVSANSVTSSYLFNNIGRDVGTQVHIGESVTTIPKNLFNSNKDYSQTSYIKSLDFNNSINVTTLEDYCFGNLQEIEELYYPYTITTIGTYVNQNNYNLKTVFLYNTIGQHQFKDCYSLTNLIIDSELLISYKDFLSNNYHLTGTVNEIYNPDGLKDGSIYVQDELVQSYKSASGWSTYSDCIKSINTAPLNLFREITHISFHKIPNKLYNGYNLKLNKPRVSPSGSSFTDYFITTSDSTIINIGEDNKSFTCIGNIGQTCDITLIVVDKKTGNQVSEIINISVIEIDILTEVDTTGYVYTFNQRITDGWWESTNKGIHSTTASCRLKFTAFKTGTLRFSYIQHAESSYDYSIWYNIDSSSQYYNGKGSQSSSIRTLDYIIDETYINGAEHYITITYRKDSSANAGNDNLQFTYEFIPDVE